MKFEEAKRLSIVVSLESRVLKQDSDLWKPFITDKLAKFKT